MVVFLCLGNIGKKYENTPHNAGFVFADKLSEFLSYDRSYTVSEFEVDKKLQADVAMIRRGFDKVGIILKPRTLMNRSGEVASALLKRLENLQLKDIVVIHDDLDIKLGEYKIQRGIGPKAHNGIISVESSLGAKEFLRVRLGVESRSSDDNISGEDFVLLKMDDDAVIVLNETIVDSIKQLRIILKV